MAKDTIVKGNAVKSNTKEVNKVMAKKQVEVEEVGNTKEIDALLKQLKALAGDSGSGEARAIRRKLRTLGYFLSKENSSKDEDDEDEAPKSRKAVKKDEKKSKKASKEDDEDDSDDEDEE